jgi:micrococcal nuclease
MKTKVIVERIIDGDTIVCRYHSIQIVVRIANIDVPELKTKFGKQVKEFVTKLLENKQVDIIVLKKDTYNRYVSEVIVDGKQVDEILVSKGLAWHWEKYSHKPMLTNLERIAQDEKLGIWSADFAALHFNVRHPQSKTHIGL